MENKKKMIFNVLFLFLVFAATLYGVFRGEDLSEIAEILKTVNLYWLLPGVACVIIFNFTFFPFTVTLNNSLSSLAYTVTLLFLYFFLFLMFLITGGVVSLTSLC